MNRLNSFDNNFNYRLVFAVIFLLAALAMIFLVLWPKTQELKAVRENLKNKRNEFETKEEYLLSLSDIDNQLNDYLKQVDLVKQAFPDSPNLPSLFNYFQKISSESGLILLNIGEFNISHFSDEVSEGEESNYISKNFKKIDFNIELKGTYSAFKAFVSKIEKSARLIKVENVFLTNDSTEENTGVLSFSLKIKVYSY